MTDAPFPSQQAPFTKPKVDTANLSPRHRKVIGQCPTCHQSFTSRHELDAHISNPQIHTPALDSDAISFGELSSSYDSADEDSYLPKPSKVHRENEPTLDTDGFEFSDSGAPNLEQDGFEFLDANVHSFSYDAHASEEGCSVHSIPDSDELISAESTSFDQPLQIPPQKPRQVRGGALGVLYCGTCERYFGNEKVFKRHFMFETRHGEEPQDIRELYYRVWGSSWADETKDVGGLETVVEGDAMEM